MSFNTSTSGGENGNDGGGGDSLYSKKLKRQKIPKRGPGVAELEKILRDQERKDDNLGGGSSLISSSSKNAVPFSVDHDQFIIPSYGRNVRGSSSSLGITNHLGEGNGGVHGRRSGIFLPQNASSPAMWSSHEINSTDFIGTDSEGTNFASSGFAFPTRITDGSSSIIPSPVIPQKHMQYIPAMINPFGQSGLSSSLPSAVAGANYHHIEPPSNQISCCQYSNAWPEQEKA
ncbi:uncharacterized protein LOC120005819 [Tripterygium wilfordii]|uniref:uncharacterized protein LOC120005819 n=1 Tax=Tripterygium wilfordii TaxID=458696 RepID=UPI0018F84E3D|nr:uncharacterized protein LOC120005819 [Tripterygium wilfordii]